MTYQEWHERFFTALHKVAGICGHCGKKDCAGKASHSVLPETLSRDAVIAAGVLMKQKRKLK